MPLYPDVAVQTLFGNFTFGGTNIEKGEIRPFKKKAVLLKLSSTQLTTLKMESVLSCRVAVALLS